MGTLGSFGPGVLLVSMGLSSVSLMNEQLGQRDAYAKIRSVARVEGNTFSRLPVLGGAWAILSLWRKHDGT